MDSWRCKILNKIFSRILLAIIFLAIGYKSNAQVSYKPKSLDSLLKLNQTHRNADSGKIDLSIKILQQYIWKKDFEKAEEVLPKVVSIAYKLDLRKFAGVAYRKMARFYHGHANIQKAEINYLKAINEFLTNDEQILAAGAYLDLGALYNLIPDYAKSLAVNQKAVAIYFKNNNKEELGSCYVNISEIYQDLNQQKKALEYLRMALNLFNLKSEISRGAAVVYMGMGLAYFHASPTELMSMNILPNQNLKVALDNLNRALKIAEEARVEQDLIASIKMNLGLVYERMGAKDLALKSYLTSISINKNSDDKRVYAESLQALGNFYNNQKKYKNAIKLLNEALNISKTNSFLDIERDANLQLSQAHSSLKNFDESLTFYKQYVVVKDNIFNAEKEREITRRQMQLDFAIKEKDYQLRQQITNAVLQRQVLFARQQHQKLILRQQELDLSDKEKMLQRLKFLQNQKNSENEKKIQGNNFERSKLISQYEAIKREKRISKQEQQIKYDEKLKMFLFAACGLVLCTSGIIYYNQRKTTRLNKIINKQKLELEQLSRVKDRIFSVVSHDMRTPVNSLIAFVELLEAGNLDQTKFNRYAGLLKNSLTYTSSMMENLLNWAASQMQGFNPCLEELNIFIIVEDVIDSLKSTADFKHIIIDNNIPESIVCKADVNMFSLVLRNLISNAIKFTPENGKVILTAEICNDKLQILVTDTGIGMSAEQINHINKSDYQWAGVSTPGTNKEKGTGLGLLLCRTFLALMDGKLTVTSEKNQGTTFTLWLKKC